MNKIELRVKDLKKTFNNRLVFNKLNFELNSGDKLVVTGRNGSGKSTLIKILAGVLTESGGKIEYLIDDKKIDRENFYQIVGLVSPYLVVYEEFTAFENLSLFSKIRGLKTSDEEINEILNRVGLFERRNDLVRTYSSGMKQRIKYASAILHNPLVLLLDEPTSNLDIEGKNFVDELVFNFRKDGIVIVATNETQDFKYGEKIINLDEYKNLNTRI
ncbi:MAG: ABC transporter ATP-binding protein [Ignavibacteria bacterium]|jgi:heme exporter protein A|nr:ABC transporter ATP-binding protein [Ignavibacteria bacterium]MDH7527854.1 ABC transporter ATP-binding protein [Ignavibacteria bacterium]